MAVVRQMQIVLAYSVQVSRSLLSASSHVLFQIILFGVMPTWSDLLGAGLVFGIVVSIPFENIITSKLSCVSQEEDKAQKTHEKKEDK